MKIHCRLKRREVEMLRMHARRLNAPKLAAEIDDVVSDVVGKTVTFRVA